MARIGIGWNVSLENVTSGSLRRIEGSAPGGGGGAAQPYATPDAPDRRAGELLR